MNESQRLRRFAFRAPKFYLVLPLIVVLIPLFYYTSHNLRITETYALSILSILVWDNISPKLFKFRFPIQRAFFLNLVSLYVATFFYLIVIAFRFLAPPIALLLSISTIPFLRTMVYVTFTHRNPIVVHIFAIAFSIFFSFYVSILDPKYDVFILPVILSSIVYSLSSHLFIRFSVSGFVKEFSTDPVRLLSEFVNSVTADISYNDVLKKFFEGIYTTLVPREVSVIRMKTDAQNFSMVFPYVHPGPLGDLGSSNLTGKLQKNHENENLLVFHTTTTHDDNCAGDSEVEKISRVLNEKGREYTYCYEPFFSDHLTFLPLAEGGIFFLTPDDPRFDDVKISEGRKIVRRAKSRGLKWAITVDEHNNIMEEPKELGDVSYLMNEVEQAVKGRKTKKSLRVSSSRVTPEMKDVGPGGIVFVSMLMGSKKIAIVLIDGNNMELELRKKIEASLEGYDKILVCTTDNHVVNVNGLNVNPVGRFSKHEEIVEHVKNLESESQNQKEAKLEYVRRDIRLKVAGENQWEKLNRVIKTSANKAKILSATAIVLSIALSLIIFKVVNITLFNVHI